MSYPHIKEATLYCHWFHLAVPAPGPELWLGAAPRVYFESRFKAWGSSMRSVYR